MATSPDKIIGSVMKKAQARWPDPGAARQVVQWLNARNDELRILCDTSNAMGHYATTINIMRRMIDMGFRGTIRIFIYMSDFSSQDKLEMLIPGFVRGKDTNLPKDQIFSGVKLTFSWADGKPVKTPATLLICGGSEVTKEPMIKERARICNVKYYLQLQPYAWEKGNNFLWQTGSQTLTSLDGQASIGGAAFNAHGFYQVDPAYGEAIWNLYGSLERFKEVVAKAKIVQQMENRLFFSPVYGVDTRASLSDSLFNLCAAMVTFQDTLAEHQSARPMLLVAFYDLTETWDPLRALLDGSSARLPENLSRYLEQKPISDRVLFFREDSTKLAAALNSLKPNQLMILPMKGTPSDIFNWFYYRAFVPGTFEGRGTLNPALNQGHPYFCIDTRTAYPNSAGFGTLTSDIGDRVVADGVYQLVTAVRGYGRLQPEAFPFMRLAGAMFNLTYPKQSPFLPYFQALRKLFHNQQTDKLSLALRFLAETCKIPLIPPEQVAGGEGGEA
ncbi:MAG: LysM domain protein [Firmicutes bacterium]|nr:LysM domain protein [Bacillota bacterium]